MTANWQSSELSEISNTQGDQLQASPVAVEGTRVYCDGIEFCLLGKPQLFRLVAAMMLHPERLLSREKAVEALYGVDYRSCEKSSTFWETKDRGAVKQISRARAMFHEWFARCPSQLKWFQYDRSMRAWRLYR